MVANNKPASLYRAKQIYVSPSDTIMSPCTAKLSAYKSKQFGKWVFLFSFLFLSFPSLPSSNLIKQASMHALETTG